MNISYKTKWIVQKISVILFLILAFLLVFLGKDVNFYDYQSALNFVKAKLNALIIFLLISTIIIHFNIGVSSIIDDYFHDGIKKIILLLKNFLLVVLFTVTILSLCIIIN